MEKTAKAKVRYTDYIDISHVAELTEVKLTEKGVTLGGALSLSKVMDILEEVIADNAGNA